MKKLNYLLALITMLGFFTSCSDEETLITKDESSFILEGYIIDADGNVPMSGVNVEGSFGSTTTNDNGYFKIKGLNHGEYSVIYSADSYGTKKYTYDLTVDNDEPLEITYTRSVDVDMYAMDQSLTTKIWKTIGDKKVALANVEYTIELDEDYLYNQIIGVTSEDGTVSALDTLPNSSVTLKINYTDSEAGKVYKLTETNLPTAFEKSYEIEGEDVGEDFFLIDSNIFDEEGDVVSDYAVESPLTFTFNKSIASIESVSLRNISDSYSVAFNSSFDGSVLTITPVGDLENGDEYRVAFNVEDNDGYSVSESYDFNTIGDVVTSLGVPVLSRAANTEIYESTTSVDVTFTHVSGATTYEIYGKYGDQTEFKKVGTWYASTTDATATEEHTLYMSGSLPDMDIPTDGMFADGLTYTIIVRAVNSAYDVYGEFSSEFVVKKTADEE